MELHATEDVDEYAKAVTPFFRADPCGRSVPFSVMELVRQGGTVHWQATPGFWYVLDGDTVCGAGHWTPPYPLLVTDMPQAAWPMIAASALERSSVLGIALRSVTGPRPAAEPVAVAIAERCGLRPRLVKALLLMQALHAVEVPRPPGTRRAAHDDELELLGSWLTAFGAEVQEPIGPDGAGQARRLSAAGSLDVWFDGGSPVSLAGYRGPYSGVVRVGPVYTPPEHRNHGYARRLVYEITEAMLQRAGVDVCMLFADAANPVSNGIYAQVGYRTTAEHVHVELIAGDA
ncbi:MAG: GNAT family N-acetyltransferase [Candidatus Dormibacteraeota bacterium]|nr:GNAT family N-acetyltransferase [Candidatus Dormibacteraeota bacterium]